MGQRSQIYIRIPNIGKMWAEKLEVESTDAWSDDISGFVKNNEVYDKWKKMYGIGDTIIVAFHHQWLYGRSFVMVASNLLFAIKNIKSSSDYSNMFHQKFDHSNPNYPIEWMQNYMQNFFDYELSNYTRAGIERMTLLNEEHIEDNDLIYSEDFTNGDNNDGVLLMDFTNDILKYCFININTYGADETFKYLCPVDANAYIKTYYSEDLKKLISENDTLSIKEVENLLKNNISINKKFIKRFKSFNHVLTVDEIINMFPKMKQVLLKENCNAVQKQIV